MKKKTSVSLLMLVFTLGISVMVTFSVVGYATEYDIYHLSPENYLKQGQVAGAAVERANLTIYRGPGTSLSLTVEFQEGDTVLDLLESMAADYGLVLQTEVFEGLGVSVQGIGEMVNGQSDKYWIYYVNGATALQSVDQQTIEPGDKIEFRFEESIF